MKLRTCLFGMLAMLLITGSLQAVTMFSLLGDKDGYGVGCPTSAHYLAYGSYGDDNRTASDPYFTDNWYIGTKSWSQDLDLTNFLPTHVGVWIKVAGIADNRDWDADIRVNGTVVGKIQTIVLHAPDGGITHDWSRYFAFNVPLELLNPVTNTISVNAVAADDYIIDYCELKAERIVPEPTTMIMLGIGLLGVAVIRKRF